MHKRKVRQPQNKEQLSRWLLDENRYCQAKKIRAKIKETARIAENNFWEYVSGCFPEVTNLQPASEAASSFGKACLEAITAWYIANSAPEAKLTELLKENQLRLPGKKVIIGQNQEGWWAAKPGKGIKAQDVDQLQIMIHKIPDKSELLNLLKDLGYTRENIIEGIIGS